MTKAALKKLLGERALFDQPLSRLSTLGVGGEAWALLRPDSMAELTIILAILAQAQRPYMPIGQGSNILFADEGYRGALIKLGAGFNGFRLEGDELLLAEAATASAALLAETRKLGLSGLECLSGIPGSLGGALAMNAGCGGWAVGDVVRRLFYMKPDGHCAAAARDELDFDYRHLGGLPEGAIIVAAELQLTQVPAQEIETRLAELAALRKSQPRGVRSAGSFFKNPAGRSAGRFIELCGLKGVKIGGAQVSEVHANFLINAGGATARDFLKLRDLIIEKVAEKFGYILEPEVMIVDADGEKNNA